MTEPLPAAEAFRALRTALLLRPDAPQPRRIVVTGAGSDAPSAPIVAGLARSLAQGEYRVVAVDCDLRAPRLHFAFGLANHDGLAQALQNGTPPGLQAAAPNLSLLPAGPPAEDASELLGSDRCAALLDLLLEKADYLVLNTPPLDGVTDALLVATRADAVLLAVGAGRTGREEGQRAVELLRRVNAPLLGAVLVGRTG